MFLAIDIRPLTTHPFRDVAPFLLLRDAPPTFGRSKCFSIFSMETRDPSYPRLVSPAVFGHHKSPRIAIVLSLLSSAPEFSMEHSSIFLNSSYTPCFSLYISYSPTTDLYASSTLYCFAMRAYPCIFAFLLSTTGIPLSYFWHAQVPYEKSQF